MQALLEQDPIGQTREGVVLRNATLFLERGSRQRRLGRLIREQRRNPRVVFRKSLEIVAVHPQSQYTQALARTHEWHSGFRAQFARACRATGMFPGSVVVDDERFAPTEGLSDNPITGSDVRR